MAAEHRAASAAKTASGCGSFSREPDDEASEGSIDAGRIGAGPLMLPGGSRAIGGSVGHLAPRGRANVGIGPAGVSRQAERLRVAQGDGFDPLEEKRREA
jgi:hypothetical protein